jgi:hypothetical protein
MARRETEACNNFSIVECICCCVNVATNGGTHLTEPSPSDEGIHTQTERWVGGIYEVRRLDGQCLPSFINAGSGIQSSIRRVRIHRLTGWRFHKPALGKKANEKQSNSVHRTCDEDTGPERAEVKTGKWKLPKDVHDFHSLPDIIKKVKLRIWWTGHVASMRVDRNTYNLDRIPKWKTECHRHVLEYGTEA